MDLTDAKEILLALADGIDPFTGEILPPEDSCNKVEVVRAIHTVLRAVMVPAVTNDKPVKKADVQHTNAGKPWTKEEEDTLVKEYQSGIDFSRIAKAHGRSKGSITARLEKLELIAPTNRSFSHTAKQE